MEADAEDEEEEEIAAKTLQYFGEEDPKNVNVQWPSYPIVTHDGRKYTESQCKNLKYF